jgi:dihydropteroate synthase
MAPINIGSKIWEWGKRTYIMGILNVTPDSFSDGGKFINPSTAFERARLMIDEGADIIDVGGESTRPGFKPVTVEEELNRVIPIIKLFSSNLQVPISIDTYKAKTAEAAVLSGAAIVNDIWGLKADPEIAYVAAKYKVPICIMHNKKEPDYNNLIEDILNDLSESIGIALKKGVSHDNIIIDPGIGFGKTWEQNIEVMRNLERFKVFGYPLLLGTSRKSIVGKALDLPTGERVEGTIATTVFGITKGVDIVRVHDVNENKRAALMTDIIVRG